MERGRQIAGAVITTAYALSPQLPPGTLEKNLEIIGSSITGAAHNTDRVYVLSNSGRGFEREAELLERYLEGLDLPPAEVRVVNFPEMFRSAWKGAGIGASYEPLRFNEGILLGIVREIGSSLFPGRSGYVLVLDEGMTVEEGLDGYMDALKPRQEVIAFTKLAGVQESKYRGCGHENNRFLSRDEQRRGDFSRFKIYRVRSWRKLAGYSPPFNWVGGRHIVKIEDGESAEFQAPSARNEDVQLYGKVARFTEKVVLSANPRREYLGENPWHAHDGSAIILNFLYGKVKARDMEEAWKKRKEIVEAVAREFFKEGWMDIPGNWEAYVSYAAYVDNHSRMVEEARGALDETSREVYA